MKPSTDLATVTPSHIETARPAMFSEAQEEMIREMYAPTASDLEFKVLVSIARVRRLNPLLGHIHFVKRPNKITDPDGRERWADKWTCQVSIDGLRSKAEETGLYDGQDEAVLSRDEEGELVARVNVYRKGIDRPFVGVAFWSEFVQTTRKGDPVRMWQQMPRHMLAKCAEALALRKPSLRSCEEVLRIVKAAPKPSPKLEATVYRRLAELALMEADLVAVAERAAAANLPPEIDEKLGAFFRQRQADLKGPACEPHGSDDA